MQVNDYILGRTSLILAIEEAYLEVEAVLLGTLTLVVLKGSKRFCKYWRDNITYCNGK